MIRWYGDVVIGFGRQQGRWMVERLSNIRTIVLFVLDNMAEKIIERTHLF